MEEYKFQIAETIIIIIVFLIIRLITKRIIRKVGIRFKYQSGRVKITNKIIGFLLVTILTIFLMAIWGVNQSELLLFLSTILTILGVAFLLSGQ